MTTAKKLITADDLLALPDDGKRYELVRGELIEMPPAGDDHGSVGDEIAWRIGTFIRERKLGRGRLAETGFWIEAQPDTVLAPDYAFISYERMADRPGPRGYSQAIPDLVVEVFSPNDRQPQLDRKIQMWLNAGVRLALVVYPATREIVAHRDDTTVQRFGTADTLTGEPALPGFRCPVADIFNYR